MPTDESPPSGPISGPSGGHGDIDIDASGLLRSKDRRYLLGEISYEDGKGERARRRRLRNRIRQGLTDFRLLNEQLEPHDRVQILGDVSVREVEITARTLPTDETLKLDDNVLSKVLRAEEIDDAIETIAFICATCVDVGLPVDEVLEIGLHRAGQYLYPGSRAFTDSRVDIPFDPEERLEAAIEKLEAGVEIAEPEYDLLRGMLIADPDRFLGATEEVELPDLPEDAATVQLDPGQSLVWYGRYRWGDEQASMYGDFGFLDEAVIGDFFPRQQTTPYRDFS